jgi:TrwC relaxase
MAQARPWVCRRQCGREQPFLAALRDRFAAHNTALGLDRHAAVPAETRARIRGELAVEWFGQEHGRTPRDQVELVSALARWSRPAPSAVGGYDLTFSPVKSVSALWAIADPTVAAKIEQAHPAKVPASALRQALARIPWTREGNRWAHAAPMERFQDQHDCRFLERLT